MNETIGVKGGKNDRRRMLRINKEKKKKLKEYQEQQQLKQLEKKVKHLQRVTLIKVLPIVLTGQVFKTIMDNTKKEPLIDKEEAFSKLNIKVYDTNVTNVEKDKLKEKSPSYFYSEKEEKALSERTIEEKIDLSYKILLKKEATKEDTVLEEKPKKVEVKEEKQDFIPIKETPIDEEDFIKAKNKKIVEVYEEKLKEARKEMREVYFEYETVADETDEKIETKVTNVLDGLTLVISKIEKLKDNIKVKNQDLYDDNYITSIIEQYLEEFKNNKEVLEIKDSDIYTIISSKIEEIKQEKEKINEKANTQKEILSLNDIDLASLKEKYYDYEKFNKMLIDFQNEQDYLLQDVKEKVKNAVSIEEKVKVEVEAMNNQSKKLFKLLALQMFLPGPRSAKGLATATATYLYFLNNVIKPKTITKRYKVINVKDYSRDIENSLSAIDDISNSLSRTKSQLKRSINEIKNEYADYLEFPECSTLLNNLEKVKQDLEEKEFEIATIKKEQKKNLEKNNAKVLKYQKD